MTARELLQELAAASEIAPGYRWERHCDALQAARAYLSAVPQTEPPQSKSNWPPRLTFADQTPASAAKLLRDFAEMTTNGSRDWSNFQSLCEQILTDAYKGGFAAAAPQERAIPRWIPVTERLPIMGEEVAFLDDQVCYGFKDSNDPKSNRWADMLRRNRDGDYLIVCHVTHWMPLPPPPDAAQAQEASK